MCRRRRPGRRTVRAAALVLVTVLSWPGPANADVSTASPRVAGGSTADWPQFRFTPRHLGRNPFEDVLDRSNVSQLQMKWSLPIGQTVLSSPAVAGGVVYVGSDDGKVYAGAVTKDALVKAANAG